MSRVKRLQADRTNQKLYFARLACVQAEQTENVQQAQANREAAVFQLQGALLALYQELARYYAVNIPNPKLLSLQAELLTRGQVSPELVIIENLTRTGFLADLAEAYHACQYAPAPQAPEAEAESDTKIMAINITQDPLAWLPDIVLLREWHKQLVKLIEGFRDEMIEF